MVIMYQNMLERIDYMEISFYEMAVNIIGNVPDTLLWLYDITTAFLVISAFCLIIIPISLIFKRVVR